jgi:hypothetical protein
MGSFAKAKSWLLDRYLLVPPSVFECIQVKMICGQVLEMIIAGAVESRDVPGLFFDDHRIFWLGVQHDDLWCCQVHRFSAMSTLPERERLSNIFPVEKGVT